MRFFAWTCVLLGGSWVFTSPTVFGQTTQPARRGPVLRDPKTFFQVCKMRVVDGFLNGQAQIPSEDAAIEEVNYGPWYLMQGSNGPTVFSLWPIDSDKGDEIIDQLYLGSFVPAEPELRFLRTINSPGSRLTLITFAQRQQPVAGRRGRSPSMQVGMTLTAQTMIMEPTPGGGFVSQGGAGNMKRFNSPDFVHFLKEHPDEVNEYVRPILQSFNCEFLVGHSDRELMQVFPELFRPDEATVKEVNALVDKLDSDSPEDREAAFAKLKEIGLIAGPVLAAIDKSSLSPQQSIQVKKLCKIRLIDQEVADLLSNPDFLIDCLNDQRLAVRAAALGALKKAIGHDVSFDFGIEDSVARSQAVEALRSQLKPATRP